jgi:hypothetical protein
MSRRRPSKPIDDAQTAVFEGRRASRDTKRGYDGGSDVQKAIKVISMKTPSPVVKPDEAKARAVKLRSLAEMSAPSINLPLGNFAPPRDEEESARRHTRGNAMIALVVLAIGVIVTIVIVLVAR